MSGLVRRMLEAAVRARVARLTQLDVAENCRVRWLALLGLRGGRLRIGSDSIVNCRIVFDSPTGRVSIGERCFLGASNLICHTAIDIEDDVIMSWGVTIVDHDSHTLDWHGRSRDVADWMVGRKDWSGITVKPVRIERRAWIGFGAVILKGVSIGEGAVVGAGAVVTRDVAPYTVVAGNPARVVRQLNPSQIVS